MSSDSQTISLRYRRHLVEDLRFLEKWKECPPSFVTIVQPQLPSLIRMALVAGAGVYIFWKWERPEAMWFAIGLYAGIFIGRFARAFDSYRFMPTLLSLIDWEKLKSRKQELCGTSP